MAESSEGRTLTRADLAEAVFERVGISRNESADLVEVVLNEMANALIAGQQVKISGFGTFSTRKKRSRVGRNPKTGQEVMITPRTVVVFKASNILKKSVGAGPVAKGGATPPKPTAPSTPSML